MTHPSHPIKRALWLVGLVITLPSCLPGSDEGIARYNAINAGAAVRSAGLSLGSAADALLVYDEARYLRRKVVLERVQLSFVGSVTANNPKPTAPPGITVKQCGRHETENPDPDQLIKEGKPSVYGALAYFNTQPAGVPDLKLSGEQMAAALAERYGAENVGLYTGDTYRYPLKMTDPAKGLQCEDDIKNDILPGSPIIVVGYRYEGQLPGSSTKTIDGAVTRDITLPCPSPLTGVVKREQTCKLHSDLAEIKPEEVTVTIGEAKIENDVKRPNKEWECDPPLTQALPAPTAAELAVYCRDPSQNITKPAEPVITMSAENMKSLLTGNGAQYYSFSCLQGANGNCQATPYTPPADVQVRCPSTQPPARFVYNPITPLQLNGAGEVQSQTPSATNNGPIIGNFDCGRGWRGDLIARYEVRRCDLTKNGQPYTPPLRQTIYHIAYAAAKCRTHVGYLESCPAGTPNAGQARLPVERDLVMTAPVALDWHPPAVAGTAAWSPSDIATTASHPQIKSEAAEIDPATGQARYVVPNWTPADIAAVAGSNTNWALKLADAMNSARSASVTRNITACDDSNAPCGAPSKTLLLGYDNSMSHPLRFIGGFDKQFDNLVCSGAGTCHALLGRRQSTCDGLCVSQGFITITAFGPNNEYLGFEQLLEQYNTKVLQPNLPPGYRIDFRAISGQTNVFDEPNTVCNLGNATGDKVIAIGTFANGSRGNIDPPFLCANTGDNHTSTSDMMKTLLQNASRRGLDLSIYSNASAQNIPGVAYIDDSMLSDTGSLTQKISNWLQSPIQPYRPCNLIQ